MLCDCQSTAHHGQGGGVGCPRLSPLEAEPEMGVLFQEEGGGKQAGEGRVLETDLRLISQQGGVGRIKRER